MTTRRVRWQRSVVACTVAGLVAAACVTLPGGKNERAAAIGSISISAPLFTPLDRAAEGSDRLSFRDLRKEEHLDGIVNQPSIGMASLAFTAIRAALAVDVQPPAGAGTGGGASQDPTASPPPGPVPAPANAPARLALSPAAEERMIGLLERSAAQYRLPPDQVATLIAAYKTYMVNLEKYYNVDGFGYDAGAIFDEYLPYKVHFTVSVEPGWYTRYYQYDAVAELVLGKEALAEPGKKPVSEAPPEVVVLTVSPPETAQAIDRITGALQEVAVAATLSGSLPSAGLRAEFDSIVAEARRLEGLAANKTLVVGFPDAQSVRVRVRPTVVPSTDEQELQPTVRVLTGIVLVRNASDDKMTYLALGGPPLEASLAQLASAREAANKAHLEFQKEYPDLAPSLAASQPADSTPQSREVSLHRELDRMPEEKRPDVREKARHVFQLEEEVRDAMRQHERVAVGYLRARPCSYRRSFHFDPGLKSSRQRLDPSVNYLLRRDWPVERHDVSPKSAVGYVHVPPWYGDLRTRLELDRERIGGAYWGEFSDYQGKRVELERARSAVGAPEADLEALRRRVGKEPSPAEQQAIAAAVTSVSTAKSNVDQAKQAAEQVLAASLRRGQGVLRFALSAPRYSFSGDRVRSSPLRAAVLGRAIGPGSVGGAYLPLGSGDCAGTFTLDSLDLSTAVTVRADGSLVMRPLRIAFEVVVIRAPDLGPRATIDRRDILQSTVAEVILLPGAVEAPKGPTTPPSKDSEKGK